MDTIEFEREQFEEHVWREVIGALEVASIYLGDRLGLYRALEDGSPVTAEGLAVRTGVHQRYAREWLEQQAVAGILEVEDPGAEPEARRFRLPAAHAAVLADPDSLFYSAPLSRLVRGVMEALPQVVRAYRTGGGVEWSAYGADTREGQAASNRPAFLGLLGRQWLPGIADVHARLQGEPPARVADIGCGEGWSSIGIALAYPKAEVHGFDLDSESIEAARRHAEEEGLDGRVRFEARDAGDPELAGRYDLVTAFECIHDMADPVGALRAMRRMAGGGGTVLVADEPVPDRFTAPGEDVERYHYGWSVTCCLPAGMSEQPSAMTGTVMRTDTMATYAEEAGFARFEVLPIEEDWFRFYRLTP